MNEQIELLERVKNNILEKMIKDKCESSQPLTETMLSIWEVKERLYEECRKQVESILLRDKEEALSKF